MRKLFLSSIALTIFSISIIVFQLSCQKHVSAQNPNTVASSANNSVVQQLNKIIFKKVVENNDAPSVQIWTANYDGTNAVRVKIKLPDGISFSDDMTPVISPDGQKIFFTAGTSSFNADLYSCSFDGSSVTKIVGKGGANNNIILGEAY